MPPFRSRSQARYMFSQHPEIAKEFADATPNIKKLPEYVKSRKGECHGGRIERESSPI